MYIVSYRFHSCEGLYEELLCLHFQDWFESSSVFLFIKLSIWLHVVVVPCRGVITWMPLEVGSLFRTVTYLLVSIYRFHMLASVSKAAARLKFQWNATWLRLKYENIYSRWIRGTTSREELLFWSVLADLKFLCCSLWRMMATIMDGAPEAPWCCLTSKITTMLTHLR